jgi:hypothetical protein
LTWLRRLGAVHTVVDGPQGADNSVPAIWETTHTDFALVRLHGRNAETYNAPAKTAGERFDYDYPDNEIQGVVAEAVRLAFKVRNTHLIFNNCDLDKGQRNGMTALRMVAERAGERPDLSGWNPPNGILGRLTSGDTNSATSQLPPVDPSSPQFVDVAHGRRQGHHRDREVPGRTSASRASPTASSAAPTSTSTSSSSWAA